VGRFQTLNGVIKMAGTSLLNRSFVGGVLELHVIYSGGMSNY
jgi:hypothetical protein